MVSGRWLIVKSTDSRNRDPQFFRQFRIPEHKPEPPAVRLAERRSYGRRQHVGCVQHLGADWPEPEGNAVNLHLHRLADVLENRPDIGEALIIDEWIEHMESVRVRLAPEVNEPILFHWSPAEVTNFQNAYNSAKDRHKEHNWPSMQWFDFLGKVVREEPVVVKGAFAFGLKAVSTALHSQGLIETIWGDGPSDGLGAMVAAWWCDQEARRLDVPIGAIDLMGEVVEYNEVDCKVMMEIIQYLRANH